MIKQILDSFAYTRLATPRSSMMRNRLLLILLFVLSIVSIVTTLVYSKVDWDNTFSLQDSEEHEKVIENHQANHHEKRTIIFPSSFPLSNREIVDMYVHDLEEALDPEDLIFKNKLSHRLPNDLSFSKQEMELFSSNSESLDEDHCGDLSSKISVEATPAMNKNADLRKVLTRFMTDNGTYYNELKPFFPDLEKELREDTIDKHWYQLIGSSVWLKQYGVHLMVSRIVYTVKDQGTVQYSLTYLQVFDRNWKELDNVELVIPTDEGSFKTVSYPSFAPMPVYHNANQISQRYYGVEDPRIQLITNSLGHEEPIILYNSHHRKISETEFENDTEGMVKFRTYRSIFIGWLWRTQRGKSNLEELPIKDQQINSMEYIKVKELLRPNNERKGQEKNWAMFFNNQERLQYGYDNYIYFVYQFKNLKILKCPIYEDEPCSWEFEANEYMGAGELHGGSELINVNTILEQYNYPELESLLDRIPEGRELWIGFARAVIRKCGCGPKMYRPNLVVLMKDNNRYKFAYISSFAELGIEILPWSENTGLCDGTNLIIPNGISSWTIEKEDEKLVDYMAFTISRRDATVDVVYLRGLLNALLLDQTRPKLLDGEQLGFTSSVPAACALKASEKFCKVYGANVGMLKKVEED
ncbi:Beta-mannosyltransferase 1 [Candida viswanathii]|uniref:Beta-mannosyltransferase 1 n=1 Tax=Candida viswanathii TaxID=5486 RepID=A0A367YHC5_9ASCO|nr:Beta-mannosyltransferase 1 [Candida viswanathii]